MLLNEAIHAKCVHFLFFSFFYFTKVKKTPAKLAFFPREWPNFTKTVADYCFYTVKC